MTAYYKIGTIYKLKRHGPAKASIQIKVDLKQTENKFGYIIKMNLNNSAQITETKKFQDY